MTRYAALAVFLAAVPMAATPTLPQSSVQANRLVVPRDTFTAWMSTLSNAGRWGKEDQLGTLNLITSEKRRRAAQSVRDGVSISMSSDVVSGPGPNVLVPMRLNLEIFDIDSTLAAAIDSVAVVAHGFSSSHLDVLSHVMYRNRLYNGFARDQLTPGGARVLGVETMHSGIVTRGVLVDAPRLMGVPYLAPGAPIMPADLERWERRTGVRIQAGDALLLRTGRGARTKAAGAFIVTEGAGGPHPSLAHWLKERGVAILGSDVTNDVFPSFVPGISQPMHALTIVALGMPLLDNLDLEAAADYAARRARFTFLFVASPLRIRGGTGSLVNPLAIF